MGGEDEEVGQEPANNHEEPDVGQTPAVHSQEVHRAGEEVALHVHRFHTYPIVLYIQYRNSYIINQYKSAECSMILRVKKLLGVNELVIEKGRSNGLFTYNLNFLYILFFLYLLYISNNQYWMIKHCSAIKQCNVSSIKVIIIDKFSWFEL